MYYSNPYSNPVVIILGLLGAAGLAFVPASIAGKKGYSFGGFWCFSFFCSFIPAIIVAACLKPKYGSQQYRETMHDMRKYPSPTLQQPQQMQIQQVPGPDEETIWKNNPLARRAAMSLEDGEWAKADELYEQILNTEPENARAYIGKICAELHVSREDDLQNHYEQLIDNLNYKRALKFAGIKYKLKLEMYALSPDEQAKYQSSEVQQAYQRLMDKLEEIKQHNSTPKCVELASEINRLIGSDLVKGELKGKLIELSTPIKGDTENSIHCALCGANQIANRLSCYRCGIKFTYGQESSKIDLSKET